MRSHCVATALLAIARRAARYGKFVGRRGYAVGAQGWCDSYKGKNDSDYIWERQRIVLIIFEFLHSHRDVSYKIMLYDRHLPEFIFSN